MYDGNVGLMVFEVFEFYEEYISTIYTYSYYNCTSEYMNHFGKIHTHTYTLTNKRILAIAGMHISLELTMHRSLQHNRWP